MMIKAIVVFFFVAATVSCQNAGMEDDVEAYEDSNEEEEYPDIYFNDKGEEYPDVDENTEDINADPVPTTPKNTSLRMCHGVNLPCQHCSSCYPGGWCITNPGHQPKCLCMYGWTGPNAEWVPDTNDPAWGKNRIRADNCLTDCHYTHHVKNATCVKPIIVTTTTPAPTVCDPRCNDTQGVCQGHHCKCCRGWSGPDAVYDHTLKTYLAKVCNKECPFLGEGKPNPTCKNATNNVPACNPKCEKSEGKCMDDGRCLCCLSWTGPNAELIKKGTNKEKIAADFCDVYCPDTVTKKNQLCVTEDYIKRRRAKGHTFHITI